MSRLAAASSYAPFLVQQAWHSCGRQLGNRPRPVPGLVCCSSGLPVLLSLLSGSLAVVANELGDRVDYFLLLAEVTMLSLGPTGV